MNTRRIRRRQKLQVTILVSTLLLILFVLLFVQLASNTILGSKDVSINYISVEIVAEDTLWDIATEFVNKTYYETDDYILEIISINGLKSETIYPGQRLTLPIVVENYYSASN